MSGERGRSFSREFKLRAIERLEAGERMTALSAELGVSRQVLHGWRELYRVGGAQALRSRRGRPSRWESPGAGAAHGPPGREDALALARRRISELEGKIGRQQLELDFFRGALRRIEGSRRPSDGPGATVSSHASGR